MSNLTPTYHPSLSAQANASRSQLTPTYFPPPRKDIDSVAKTIVESGRGNFFSGPDLNARRQVMAREVAGSSLSDGAAILKTLAQKTDLFTLLDFRGINQQVDDGEISHTERERLANAFAYAYNSNQLEEFLTFDYSQARDLVEFLDSSSSPEVQSFKESYAKQMVEIALRDDALPHVQMGAAHLAGHIMCTEPELAAQVLQGLEADQLRDVFVHMNNAGPQFGYNPLASGADAVYHDNWTAVMNALSQVPSEKMGDLPANLAAVMVAEKQALADPSGQMLGTQRAEALTRFLINHGAAALDGLTQPSYMGSRSLGDTNGLHDEIQTRVLGQLFEMTIYNSNVEQRDALLAVVREFGQAKAAIINDKNAPDYDQPYGPVETSFGQINILGAGLRYGVTQEYIDAAASVEQRKAVAEFVVDLALSAVPFGKLADQLTGSQLAALLPDSIAPDALIRNALQDMGNKVVTDATDGLTAQARSSIVDLMARAGEEKFSEEMEMVTVETIVSSLHDAETRIDRRTAINELHDRASN